MVVSCSTYSTLKMEAVCLSEISVDFQLTTRRYIPEDGILQTLLSSMICFCDLVVRVPGYRTKGPGFDSQRYQIL
jgi:hypothetical protein